MTTALEILQLLLALLWSPFQLLAWIGRLIDRSATAASDALVRPLYWAVVSVRRRRLGQPAWKEIDWRIGIGPPCGGCGRNVPPEKHEEGCGAVIEEAETAPSWEETREIVLTRYAQILQANGIAVSKLDEIDLGALLEAAAQDTERLSEKARRPIGRSAAIAACERIMDRMRP